MFAQTYMPKIDENNNLEKERKRKLSIIQTIRRGFFTHVRHLLENIKADPNELFKANIPQPLSSFLAPVISNANSPNGPPVVSNLSLINGSIYSFHGRTPLMFCASIEDETWAYGIAQNLLEKGAKLGLKDPNGLNALMYACIHAKESLVNLYLNALGDFHLLSVDNFGNTALHIASLGHNESICKTLCDVCVKYDINPYTDIPKNKLGHTTFDLCFVNGHKSCMENYNKINEHFSSKRAKQTSTRIHTAFKKEEPILRTPSAFSNESASIPNSRLSSIHSSNYHYHNSLYNTVHCPSVLMERSEISFKTGKTLTTNGHIRTENMSSYHHNSSYSRSHHNHSQQLNPSPMNISPSTSHSNTSINLQNFLLTTTPGPNLFNSLETYRAIYPYKEHLIKASSVIKKPKKEDKTKKIKSIIFELRPLTANKSYFKNKTNFVEFKSKVEDNNQEVKQEFKSKSIITEKSILIKREKTEMSVSNEAKPTNSPSYFKSVSFSKIFTTSEAEITNKQESSNENHESLENSRNDNWRKSFSKLTDLVEWQKSESFRKGHHYTPSSIEDLTSAHANNLADSFNNASMANMSLLNKRLSIMSQPRKSIIPGSNQALSRRQSNLATLVNMKMNLSRKQSVIATS